ncbi:MAG: putative membrane protein [bacterium]|jgi:putative membrane protein
MSYEIVKVLHIVAMLCWFAGLFYLPRLFVYHTTADKKSDKMLQTMERKLYRFIMLPSMILTWVFGLWLLHLMPSFMENGWIHAKITLDVLLTGYHHICGAHVKRFAAGKNMKSERYFRIFNELPVILLILIVVLVVMKPF